jgi:hypothetical protein
MNENDLKLLEGLRGLAADGPREAPEFVEQRLLGEFQKRSHERRRNRWLGLGTAAIAAGLAVMLWVRTQPVVQRPTMARLGTAAAASTVAQTPTEDVINFYRLPDADELPPMESATIVRVQLPMSSLRLIGLPVSEDRAAEFVQADMLVGQDGLARGVRFVQ